MMELLKLCFYLVIVAASVIAVGTLRKGSGNLLLDKVSADVKEKLSRKPSFRKLEEEEREQYKSSSWKYGLGIYLFIVAVIVGISIAEGTTQMIPGLLLWTLPIALVIVVLIFRDASRISSKKQLYVVKAYCVSRIYGRNASMTLVYYNFIMARYETGWMSMTASARKKDISAGSFVEALVEQKEEKLKLLDVV